MGTRLYVATKYDVKLEGGHINNGMEAINSIIMEFTNAIDDIYSNHIEIEEREYLKMIDRIKENEVLVNEILENSRYYSYSVKEIIDIFESFYKKRDRNNDFIVLEWF